MHDTIAVALKLGAQLGRGLTMPPATRPIVEGGVRRKQGRGCHHAEPK
jgi:hypothetical protein